MARGRGCLSAVFVSAVGLDMMTRVAGFMLLFGESAREHKNVGRAPAATQHTEAQLAVYRMSFAHASASPKDLRHSLCKSGHWPSLYALISFAP